MEAPKLTVLKEALKEIIANRGFIPDQESFELMHQIVPWPAVEVGVFNSRGELLLHHRHFTEWPGEWANIEGWYVPGGYMKIGGDLEYWCRHHMEKDGVLSPIRFVETCGVIKWKPGEHSFSNPVSIACACVLEGDLKLRAGEESHFKFTDVVVESPIPHHTELQEMLFQGWARRHTLLER